jgi:hypothetical protein
MADSLSVSLIHRLIGRRRWLPDGNRRWELAGRATVFLERLIRHQARGSATAGELVITAASVTS